MAKWQILVIDPDPWNTISIKAALTSRGYDVSIKRDGREGYAPAHDPNLALLIMENELPEICGINICRDLRSKQIQTPIIFVSSKSGPEDIEEGFEAGADDYIAKPFSTRELVARVDKMLKRPPGMRLTRYNYAGLDICKRTKSVLDKDGRELELRRKEFQILALLVEYPGRCISRNWILDCTSPPGTPGSFEAIDVHISNLRKRLDGRINGRIESIYGMGYRLKANKNVLTN